MNDYTVIAELIGLYGVHYPDYVNQIDADSMMKLNQKGNKALNKRNK